MQEFREGLITVHDGRGVPHTGTVMARLIDAGRVVEYVEVSARTDVNFMQARDPSCIIIRRERDLLWWFTFIARWVCFGAMAASMFVVLMAAQPGPVSQPMAFVSAAVVAGATPLVAYGVHRYRIRNWVAGLDVCSITIDDRRDIAAWFNTVECAWQQSSQLSSAELIEHFDHVLFARHMTTI